MASNTNIQVSNLDFGDIKQNFTNYLQSQSTFKDYNFSGSALSTLLDVLAYNTQYNSYYLNMVANEMFLDSALQRSSVVSHAKLMNYVPQSAMGPVALINVVFNYATTSTFTIPQYTNFMSESINGTNYNYVTTDVSTVSVYNNVASFDQVELKQGTVSSYTFTVNSTNNPNYVFEIPDTSIDVSTMKVLVQQSYSNTSYQVYNPTTNYLPLTPRDAVYFLQEAVNGNYQIYFGDGVLGKQLSDGNIISVTYISTSGVAGGLANNFVLMDNIGGGTVTVNPIQAATQGRNREAIESIKFQAPKAFAGQGRAVSKNDYITMLQQNTLGVQFDAVSVWGGEENDPPAYGQVFISLKPAGAYDLTTTQKQLLMSQVIKPISVVTVEPTLVDPDYTYIQLTANVLYNQSQTALTLNAMQTGIQNAIYTYSSTYLNTFNSTFSSYQVLDTIKSFNQSVITSDFLINLQKKFYPTLGIPTTYNLYYNSALQRGIYGSAISSSPGIKITDPANPLNTLTDVYFEEIPNATGGLSSISILNTGFNYSSVPTVVIKGDGKGATASCTLVNGTVNSVTLANTGTGYTSASAYIIPATSDTTGKNAVLVCNLEGQFGTLRTYYNDVNNGKVVVNPTAGTIDYLNGTITLANLNALEVNNPLGQLTLTAQPTTTIISSTFNRIITIDPYDPAAIVVNVNAKRN